MIMKRYLYILLSAVAMLCGCEPEKEKADVFFIFTPVEVVTTDTTATITNRSYMTVDGLRYDDAKFYLEYTLLADEEYQRGGEYKILSDGRFEFVLNDLAPNTQYKARIIIDGGEYGSETGSPFPFTTKEHVVSIEAGLESSITAQGLFATVNLSNIAYSADGVPQTLASLKFEYKRKYSESDSEPWIAKEFAASTIQGGELTINLPFEGEDYLMELNEYYYRISLTPEDANYRTYTFGEDTFKCKKAVITSEISAPSLSYDIVNDVPIITAVVNSAKLFYDGVSLEDYAHDNPTYQINYRAKGSDDWQITTVYQQDGVFTLKVNASTFTIGDRYEFQMAVYAGSSHNNALYSPISEITIPKEVTPDVPVVPEPPVGGDTSSIEGTWHLTEWRGATPSFEVYLDINATGGVTLYQRLENNYWEVFQSSATIENGVIWGVYTDGVAWGARYNLSVSDTTMTWVDTEDATDISIYTRSNLPTHIPMAPTRATTPKERFL